MPLADDIRAVGARGRAELVAAHDYYAYSVAVWEDLRDRALADPTVNRTNPVTGSTASGADLVALADEYTRRHLPEMTLQHFLSIFEVFVADLLRLWLTAFPKSLASKVLTVGELLEAGDVLVHTSGVADEGYVAKAGALARAAAGEHIEIPKPYHRGVWELVLRLTDDLAAAAAAKA